jgi:hypothetical protein
VPVIVEKAHPRAPDILKSKYVRKNTTRHKRLGLTVGNHHQLAPNDMSVGAFLQEIKRHLVKTEGDKATESIFLFVAANSMPPSNWLMSQVYEKHKNEDGFLCKLEM